MRLVGTHPRPAAAQPRPRCRLNRVVQHHWTAYGASPGLRDGFDYGYDANSNRLWRANLTAQALDKPFDELYQYDSLNRLVDFQRGTLNAEHTAILGTPKKEQTWNLDPTGNWSHFASADDGVLETDQTRISNPANEITEISSWFPPGYDHAGNMTRIPKPAAPQEGFLATWDAWNRMVKLIDAGTSDTVQENAYDAQTWRTVRKDYEAGSLTETRHFFYTALWQSIEERLDAATTPERQHVWGRRYVDDLILLDRDNDEVDAPDERLYRLYDANWNTSTIVNTLGGPLERYIYEPYAATSYYDASWEPTSASEHDIGYFFTSRLLDVVSHLYYLRIRYLHADMGAFICRDPLGIAVGPSFYTFVGSNPPVSLDPTGLFKLVYYDLKFNSVLEAFGIKVSHITTPHLIVDATFKDCKLELGKQVQGGEEEAEKAGGVAFTIDGAKDKLYSWQIRLLVSPESLTSKIELCDDACGYCCPPDQAGERPIDQAKKALTRVVFEAAVYRHVTYRAENTFGLNTEVLREIGSIIYASPCACECRESTKGWIPIAPQPPNPNCGARIGSGGIVAPGFGALDKEQKR